MEIYAATIPQFIKMLDNLEKWIDKAVEHAKKKNFDPSVYLQARLAPDQYPFVRQVQAACDAAKTFAARIAGKEPPSHPDTESTIEELRGRLDKCRSFVKSVAPADLANAETRLVPLPYRPGQGIRGTPYAVELTIPNFYFHVVTAYAILRHNGVDLGKADYLGGFPLEPV
jgi:hypothetical protein